MHLDSFPDLWYCGSRCVGRLSGVEASIALRRLLGPTVLRERCRQFDLDMLLWVHCSKVPLSAPPIVGLLIWLGL